MYLPNKKYCWLRAAFGQLASTFRSTVLLFIFVLSSIIVIAVIQSVRFIPRCYLDSVWTWGLCYSRVEIFDIFER